MGKDLVAELVRYRPPDPGREWPLLLDLALDADDKTRQTACGFGYMAERTQASERTIYRWLRALHEDGHLRTVSHGLSAGRNGGKGQAAVYEIQVPPGLTASIAAQLDERSATGITCHGGAGQSEVKDLPRRMAGQSRENPDKPENDLPSAVSPPLYAPVGEPPVEGAQTGSDQNHGIDDKDQKKAPSPEREARRVSAALGQPPVATHPHWRKRRCNHPPKMRSRPSSKSPPETSPRLVLALLLHNERFNHHVSSETPA